MFIFTDKYLLNVNNTKWLPSKIQFNHPLFTGWRPPADCFLCVNSSVCTLQCCGLPRSVHRAGFVYILRPHVAGPRRKPIACKQHAAVSHTHSTRYCMLFCEIMTSPTENRLKQLEIIENDIANVVLNAGKLKIDVHVMKV